MHPESCFTWYQREDIKRFCLCKPKGEILQQNQLSKHLSQFIDKHINWFDYNWKEKHHNHEQTTKKLKCTMAKSPSKLPFYDLGNKYTATYYPQYLTLKTSQNKKLRESRKLVGKIYNLSAILSFQFKPFRNEKERKTRGVFWDGEKIKARLLSFPVGIFAFLQNQLGLFLFHNVSVRGTQLPANDKRVMVAPRDSGRSWRKMAKSSTHNVANMQLRSQDRKTS